jgi:hypothetical protein
MKTGFRPSPAVFFFGHQSPLSQSFFTFFFVGVCFSLSPVGSLSLFFPSFFHSFSFSSVLGFFFPAALSHLL